MGTAGSKNYAKYDGKCYDRGTDPARLPNFFQGLSFSMCICSLTVSLVLAQPNLRIWIGIVILFCCLSSIFSKFDYISNATKGTVINCDDANNGMMVDYGNFGTALIHG